MTEPMRLEQRLSLITLGVEDLETSTGFYREVFGWRPAPVGGEGVTFFQMNGFILGLFPRDELAADAGVGSFESGRFSRVALAYNVRERDQVDAVLNYIEEAGVGARVVKNAEDAFWGGRSGYFADPDGFLWEVAWNPGFQIREDGSIMIGE